MDEKRLNELAGRIVRKDFVLFAGAGLSIEGGGMTWDQLVDETKTRFQYDSPLTNNYEILHDIVQKNSEKEVHDFIKSQLEGVSLEDPIAELAGLPWFTTFTTNYDTALEDALREKQETRIRTIIDSGQFELSNSPTHLQCVKLMGSIDRDPSDPGSMVLTRGDRERVKDERSRMFDMLGSHAANVSFLFIGYSFSDDIFTDILEMVTNKTGTPRGEFYALFPGPLDEETEYRLDSLGVTPIIGDLPEFALELCERVSARDTTNYRTKAIPFGDEVVQLPFEEVGDFIESYDPVLNERLEREITPKEFYRGNSNGLLPFSENWHFQRSEEEAILQTINDRDVDFISISGPPGSGRSFLISAVIERLIHEERSLAIEIPSHTWDNLPYADELNRFIKKVNSKAKSVGVDGPDMVALFSYGGLESDDIAKYEHLIEDADLPLVLISEAIENHDALDDPTINFRFSNIELNEEIPRDSREDFKEYLVRTTQRHKIVGVTEDQAEFYLSEEPKFLPVMYRSIYQTKRSIQDIISEEYGDLDGDLEKKLVQLCAIATSLGIPVPVTVCRRYLSELAGESIDWREIFDIQDRCQAFLIETVDSRETPLFSVYHSIVANYICEKVGKNTADEVLHDLARSVDLKSDVESDFIGELVITHGVNAEKESDVPFTFNGLEHALEWLSDRQPARPILHHLARLKQQQGRPPEEFIPILDRALGEESEKYASYERKENIQVTLANLRWKSLRDNIDEVSLSDTELQEIFGHLENARVASHTPHSYLVQAQIFHELSQEQRGQEQFNLLNRAIDLLEDGIARTSRPDDRKRLHSKYVEIMNDIERDRAEKLAEEILEEEDSGEGYYTLAKLDLFGQENYTKALANLDKAVEASDYPAGAIDLRIKILLEDDYQQYEKMERLARELEARRDFDPSWQSLYRLAVVHAINGNYESAKDYFNKARRSAPSYIRRVSYFWREGDSRKIFEGTIKDISSTEGFIHNHNVPNWVDSIYFTPYEQDTDTELKSGLDVKFELGFSIRGPQAFELELM